MNTQELQRYPRLHARLVETVSELLRERLGPTSDYVQSLIAIQAAYINTNHPAFMQNMPAEQHRIANLTRDAQADARDEDDLRTSSANDGAARTVRARTCWCGPTAS
jgi:dynamin 1-like protein